MPAPALCRCCLALLFFLAPATLAAPTPLPRPSDRQFILDEADLLSPAAELQLQQRCDQLLRDTGVPVAVLTIKQMQDYGSEAESFQIFARRVLKHWADRHPLQAGQPWHQGVLLLISRRDGLARIEIGPDRDGVKGSDLDQISAVWLRPGLRRGNPQQAVASAVRAIDDRLRGRGVPARTTRVVSYLLWAGLAIVMAATLFSSMRSGSRGVAARAWGSSLRLPSELLYRFCHQRKGRPAEPLPAARWSEAY